jgi:hypothetical protein
MQTDDEWRKSEYDEQVITGGSDDSFQIVDDW